MIQTSPTSLLRAFPSQIHQRKSRTQTHACARTRTHTNTRMSARAHTHTHTPLAAQMSPRRASDSRSKCCTPTRYFTVYTGTPTRCFTEYTGTPTRYFTEYTGTLTRYFTEYTDTPTRYFTEYSQCLYRFSATLGASALHLPGILQRSMVSICEQRVLRVFLRLFTCLNLSLLSVSLCLSLFSPSLPLSL
jgi:hypothetical protein